MEEQAQHLIDATTAAFKAGKIAQNPFAAPPPGGPGKPGVAIPPPNSMSQRPGMAGIQMPPGMPPGMMGMPPPAFGMNPQMMRPTMMMGMRMNGPPPNHQ